MDDNINRGLGCNQISSALYARHCQSFSRHCGIEVSHYFVYFVTICTNFDQGASMRSFLGRGTDSGDRNHLVHAFVFPSFDLFHKTHSPQFENGEKNIKHGKS